MRKFVEKLGGGMHSIALRTSDIEATHDWVLGHDMEEGVRIADSVFFFALGGQPRAPARVVGDAHRRRSPIRVRAALPEARRPVRARRALRLRRAAVVDPVAAAEKLALIMDTEVLRSVPGAGPGEIGAMVSLVDCVLVLHALPESPADWPWGPAPTRPRFTGQGLEVEDLPKALARLETVGIRPVAELEHTVLLDPASTPAPTFLFDELFAEDPRRGVSDTSGLRGE